MLHIEGPLEGLTFGHWAGLLRKFGRPRLGRRALAEVSLISLMNSVRAAGDRRAMRNHGPVSTCHDPVFILGFWRSGTTHLHNLFAVDERLAFPAQFEVNHPSTFLTTGQTRSTTVKKRDQDNVMSGDLSPDEDEFAFVTTTFSTPYLSLLYPARTSAFFQKIPPSTLTGTERAELERAMQRFHEKLTVRYEKPLVYKSPAHTARIPLLLKLFPNARFVHLHRDPVTLFRSNLNLYKHMLGDRLTPIERESLVIDTLREIYDAFLRDRHLIPPGRLVNLSFDALEQEPLDSMRQIYGQLSLPDFAAIESELTRYCDSVASYKRNTYEPLTPQMTERLSARWKPYFEEWNYSA